MKKYILITICLASLISTQSKAQESYLCISEAIGGVAYDDTTRKWVGTKFTNTNEKILISKKNEVWKFKIFNGTYEEKCGKMNEYGIIRCDIIGGDFIFNKKTKRFIKTHINGYISGIDNNDNTPAVIIGSCSQL